MGSRFPKTTLSDIRTAHFLGREKDCRDVSDGIRASAGQLPAAADSKRRLNLPAALNFCRLTLKESADDGQQDTATQAAANNTADDGTDIQSSGAGGHAKHLKNRRADSTPKDADDRISRRP